jgi:hypothetical protein
VGCAKWDALLAAHGIAGPRREELSRDLRSLMEPWGSAPIGAEPEHFSFASNDGAPIELSAAWSPTGFEARVYVEPLPFGDAASARGAALASIRRLGRRAGVDLGQYQAVQDLFFAPAPAAPPAFWMLNALMADGSGGKTYKAYLNPNVGGSQHWATVLGRAMGRLGMADAWAATGRHIVGPAPGPVPASVSVPVSAPVAASVGASVAPPPPEALFLALDLCEPGRARAKAYFRHQGMDDEALERWAALAADFEPGVLSQVHRLVSGSGAYTPVKPVVTSLTYRPAAPTATSATLYIPLDPNLPDDSVARDCVLSVLEDQGIDPRPYLATLEALGDRPVSTSHMQTYLGYRGGAQPRVSVYFATQAFPARTRHPFREKEHAP